MALLFRIRGKGVNWEVIRYFVEFFGFIGDLFRNKTLIYELTLKELQVKYLGSYLGIIWAFIQPAMTILVFWFVFQIGLRVQPASDFPFILWLMCGMIPWFFISESITNGARAVLDNSFLVKKVDFKISILPMIKILSALIIHLVFILVLLMMFMFYGYWPSIYSLQIFYFLFATIFLVMGISWITSSLEVFFKDIGQIIGIALQLTFWLTPIFWSVDRIPVKYQFVVKLNPFYYIIKGYRNALIDQQWFWNDQSRQSIYFWILALGLFIFGVIIFRKLRPYFADVC